MPQWGTQDYKRAVFEQLAKGAGGDNTDHFEHFANFSAGAPRPEVEEGVGEAFHPERLAPAQTEPQFLRAAQNMQPAERAEVAQDFFQGLQQRGLAPAWLRRTLGLGSADPHNASPEDVARLSEYARQNHPEVFRRVVADKPFFIRWMDKPLVAALVGIVAGKLMNRAYDRYER
jgi:hypothetical protein